MASATDALHSPVDFLSAMLGANLPDEPVLRAYEAECRRVPVAELAEGAPDADDIRKGYAAGVVWRGYVQETALPVFLLMYIAAFHDPRLIDIYTPTLIVTQMVDKYAPEPIRSKWLTRLKARDGSTPQGAVWMNGDVHAARFGDQWQLSGRVDMPPLFEVGIAVVAAWVEGADAPALFLVPSVRANNSANFQANTDETIFDGSEAWPLGEASEWWELFEEINGLGLAAWTIGAVALAQRRINHENHVDERWLAQFKAAFAIGWTAIDLLNWTWREMPILVSDTARLFRCTVRLAQLNTGSLVSDTNQEVRYDDTVKEPIFEWGRRRSGDAQYIAKALKNPITYGAVVAWVDPDTISRVSNSSNGIIPGGPPFDAAVAKALAKRLDAARAIAGDSISA